MALPIWCRESKMFTLHLVILMTLYERKNKINNEYEIQSFLTALNVITEVGTKKHGVHVRVCFMNLPWATSYVRWL